MERNKILIIVTLTLMVGCIFYIVCTNMMNDITNDVDSFFTETETEIEKWEFYE